MKRYIRSSFDTSIPDWLKQALTKKYSSLRDNLIKKYNIALDQARFLYQPTENSLPVYRLVSDFGPVVYIPGVNDNDTSSFNRRTRKFGAISKATLQDYIANVVYIDLDDPSSRFEKKERYQDPRYSYGKYERRGSYAGQYKRAPYIGNGEYGLEEWSTFGRTPSNEGWARDKSGYKVPNPEQRIADYYSRFPERVTLKVDKLYDRMIEVRQELMEADFNKPVRRGESNYFSEAYDSYGRALVAYRSILNSLDSNRRLKMFDYYRDYVTKEFSDGINSVKYYLNKVEELLGYEAED